MSNFEKEFNSGKMRKKRWPIWFAFVAVFGGLCLLLPKPYNVILACVVVGGGFIYAVYQNLVKKK